MSFEWLAQANGLAETRAHVGFTSSTCLGPPAGPQVTGRSIVRAELLPKESDGSEMKIMIAGEREADCHRRERSARRQSDFKQL